MSPHAYVLMVHTPGWDAALAATRAVSAFVPASRDQPIDRTVGAPGQAHAPLCDEGGQQLIEQQHDRRIAGEFVRSLALDRLDPVLLDVAGDDPGERASPVGGEAMGGR